MQHVRNYDFAAGTTIVADQIDQEFNTIQGVLNGNIDTDNLADVSVTEEKIASNAVTTNKIADAAVTNAKLDTTAGELGGAWKSFTPTWTLTGAASQAGDKLGYYIQIGKTVHFWSSFRVNASSNFGGLTDMRLTLPIAPSTVTKNSLQPFLGAYLDNVNAWYDGSAYIISNTDTITMMVHKVDGTYAYKLNANGTIPFTFGNLDGWWVSGTYEAA